MNFDGVRTAILDLLSGQEVLVFTASFENDMVTIRNRDDALTLLLLLGYLTCRPSEGDDNGQVAVAIPNHELRLQFMSTVESGPWKKVYEALNKSKQLLDDTLNCKEQEAAKGIDAAHQSILSVYDCMDEKSFRTAVGIAYYSAQDDYQFLYDEPAGKGTADIIFEPSPYFGKPPIIISLAFNKAPETALRKIHDEQYTDRFSSCEKVILAGISCSSETKKHGCRIELWNRDA